MVDQQTMLKVFPCINIYVIIMLGNRGEVSNLLQAKVPFPVANHCIAHRFPLAYVVKEPMKYHT